MKPNKGKVIYEVVRVINGIPLFYREHVERFNNSVTNSGFEMTLSKKSLALRIKVLIETNKLVNGNVRFQSGFADNGQTTFSAWASPFFYPGKELYDTGAPIATIVAQRENPNIKAHNPGLKNDVSSRIRKNGIYEVLLMNKAGLITEGSRSNIFFTKGNSIFTPTISSVLPGVTRRKVIEIAKYSGIDCREMDIVYDSLLLFDGAFITGTSPKVLPVKNIDDVFFNHQHPTIKKIMTEYDNMLEKDIESFSWARLTDED